MISPKSGFVATLVLFLFLLSSTAQAQWNFSTKYFKIHINEKGYITGMKNTTVNPQRDYAASPSPLMCLYSSKTKTYYKPVSARFKAGRSIFTLRFGNGSKAEIALVPQERYFKLKLLSLHPRKDIDDIQWGSYYTSISNLMGEIIGVARDTSEVNNFAIGLMALNENTTGGKLDNVADVAPGGYLIHSPDPKRFPLPSDLKEGQMFSLGGDGISDVAFFSHKEPYYRMVYGNAAFVDETGRIHLTYHATDRRKEKEVFFSLLPTMEANKPNHMNVHALPDVDFIGSSVALWGAPDSIALLEVMEKIVLNEELPHPTINGKWIKDPARYMHDIVSTGGNYDSTLSYMRQIGFKAVSARDVGSYFMYLNRAQKGYLDGEDFSKKPFHITAGNLSHRDYGALLNSNGFMLGRTNITNALPPSSSDVSPIPNDSLCYQVKRTLAKNISATDTVIEVVDPLYLDEIAGWEAHCQDLNMIRIGKELIYYQGISKQPPYVLHNVKRGYWNTVAASHKANETIYKPQVTLDFGYEGLIPNIFLQDEIAKYYALICKQNNLSYYDFDGQEFLFDTGHGLYGVKRFFKVLSETAASYGVPYIRFTGATLSEGSWHYQSVWNVGGDKNMYDLRERVWGSATSEGKDIRDVAFSNYFPATFGANFKLTPSSTREDFEHIQAVSVGVGATFQWYLNQKDVEACPQKYEIFKALKTWQDAREANAFPRLLKKQLADPSKNWHLEAGEDKNTWKLYQMINGTQSEPIILKRAKGY